MTMEGGPPPKRLRLGMDYDMLFNGIDDGNDDVKEFLKGEISKLSDNDTPHDSFCKLYYALIAQKIVHHDGACKISSTIQLNLENFKSTQQERMDIENLEDKIVSLETGTKISETDMLYFCEVCPVCLPGKLVNTKLLQSLAQACCAHRSVRKYEGVIIKGPKGTGKSASLLYLSKKLKDAKVTFFAASSTTYHSTAAVMMKYYNQFITMETDEKNPVEKIILEYDKPGVFFIELGQVAKASNPEVLRQLLILANQSLKKKWFVVISTSSGNGWTITAHRDTNKNDIMRQLKGFSTLLQVISSQNFTDDEFDTYAKLADITFKIGDIKDVTRGNPLLLSYFNGCKDDYYYYAATNSIGDLSRDMINDLTALFMDTGNKYFDTLENCLQLITYCIEQIPLSMSMMTNCAGSYLMRENLITHFARREEMFIEVVFPHLVPALISKIRDLVKGYDRLAVMKLPVICGYILEEEFLQHLELGCIDITAVNSEHQSRTFSFKVYPALQQENEALTSTLINDKVYHLHANHPAIDGVCVTQETKSKERYLLLIQVSLSTYRNHSSRGISITKSVTWPESAHSKVAVAKYYADLCEDDIGEDHVIYVYISPRELNVAERSVFTKECDKSSTRSNVKNKKYWYGFVKKDSNAEIVIKTITSSLGITV